MTTDVITIDRRRPLDEAVRLLQERSAPAVAVIEPDGRLVGLITTETIGELMMVSQAMPQGFRLGGKRGPDGGPPADLQRAFKRPVKGPMSRRFRMGRPEPRPAFSEHDLVRSDRMFSKA